MQTGQPWYADYAGIGLAKKGVIVVNLGYRLGVFGYLADEGLAAESPNGTTGNYGLLDQVKALEWVRNNVSAFGGDPHNVTLAGESAWAADRDSATLLELGEEVAMMNEKHLALYDILDRMTGWDGKE